MERKSMYFLSPGVVGVLDEQIPGPGSNQVMVRSLLSAISSGTEMLLYRGQFPDHLTLDENIGSLSGAAKYPLKYGYSMVGEIIEVGKEVNPSWIGKRVFSFQPHTSHFVSDTSSLHIIPEGLPLEDAVFLPNMETAISFIMDGAPVIGEKVVVFGQGVVGLLATAMLAKFPLERLVTYDRYRMRRQASLDLGAQESLDPQVTNFHDLTTQEDHDLNLQRADLVFELTGDPDGLNQAIEVSGFEGRIIVGSWYGKKMAKLDLGGWFHRGRLKIISSQVSNINSEFSGRWDKTRRINLAWEMLKRVKPIQLITHTFPIQNADEAYGLIDTNPGDAIQILFKY